MNDTKINICSEYSTDSHDAQPYSILQTILIVGITAILCIVTVVGNVLVMVSFKMDRRLQTVNNYFLLSLAVADFMIGMFSMPLFTAYTVLQEWRLGPIVCDLWLALDYLCSNASVLNLLMISFDRYFSVTSPLRYRARRTGRLAATMIACAWIISFLTWPPWILAWPYIEGGRSVPVNECYIQFLETNTYVTIGTAFAAFYIPVTVMCVLYWHIWRETENRKTYLAELLAENERASANQEETPMPQTNGNNKNGGGQILEERTCSRKLKDFMSSLCFIDCDPDGAEDENNSPGATTPSTAETPVQSSRATSLTLRPEQLAQLQALLEKQDVKTSPPGESPATNEGDSIYTIMIRLPSPSALQDTEPQPSVTMIAEDTQPNHPPPPLRTSLSTSALVVNSISDNNMHRYSSTDFLGASRFVHPKHAINKRPPKKKNQKIQEKKHDKKAARTLTAILMAFIITWTPYNVLVLIKSLVSCDQIIPQDVWNFSYYLCYLNSMINPLCYALANANFRKTYKRILTCTWRRESKLSIIVRGLHARTS